MGETGRVNTNILSFPFSDCNLNTAGRTRLVSGWVNFICHAACHPAIRACHTELSRPQTHCSPSAQIPPTSHWSMTDSGRGLKGKGGGKKSIFYWRSQDFWQQVSQVDTNHILGKAWQYTNQHSNAKSQRKTVCPFRVGVYSIYSSTRATISTTEEIDKQLQRASLMARFSSNDLKGWEVIRPSVAPGLDFNQEKVCLKGLSHSMQNPFTQRLLATSQMTACGWKETEPVSPDPGNAADDTVSSELSTR